MADPGARVGARVVAVGAPERSRSAHRARARRGRAFLPAFLLVVLTTVGASGGVLWLVAHLLPHAFARGHEKPAVADAVEVLKVALAVGMSRWVQSL